MAETKLGYENVNILAAEINKARGDPPRPLPHPQAGWAGRPLGSHALNSRWWSTNTSCKRISWQALLSRSSGSAPGLLASCPETGATCLNRGPLEGSKGKTRTKWLCEGCESHHPTGGTFNGACFYHRPRLDPSRFCSFCSLEPNWCTVCARPRTGPFSF